MRRRRHGRGDGAGILLCGALFLAACGGGGGGGSTPPPDDPGGPPVGAPQARLDRAAGCDELAEALERDALVKIGVQADSLRAGSWDRGVLEGPVPAAPVDPDLGSDGVPDDFTETNVQVSGVDEADFVETDGERIYLLHGDRLVVVDSWPPAEAALESQTPIEGFPHAMFVAGRRAVVFSQVYDETGALGGADACRFIGPPLPLVEPGLVGDVAPCQPTFTKVTLLDLAAEPRVEREIYLEGGYTAARRHQDVVRVVVQGGLGLPPGVPDFWSELYATAVPSSADEFRARVDAWEERARVAIEASSLEDWFPAQWERRDGVLAAIPPSCSTAWIPPSGAAEHGMTRILGFDMTRRDGELHDATIVGGATDVYASLDRLVLAQREWEADADGDRTAVHVFEIGAGSAGSTYLASGFVPGVPLDPFSFDFEDGVLRVATTQTRWDVDTGEVDTASQIVTARVEGSSLAIAGTTGPLAPGERVYSSRFLGDRGYLVTFRQVDPLFVVDLSDPASPSVLGELKIPGFSEYVHPLGENHLLTIGQDADEQGVVRGLALRIFDVSDDARPLLAHEHLFSGEGWSSANSDHRDFTFDAGRGLLTFPYVSYGGDYRSVLEVFAVDASSGFVPRGEIDHSALTADLCGSPDDWRCSYPPEVRRGLFIENFLYSIGGAGILAHDAADLETPVGAVALPDPGVGIPGVLVD